MVTNKNGFYIVIIVAMVGVAMSGCQSRKERQEQRLASYKALCVERGHKVNSAEYWDCVDTQELKRGARISTYGVIRSMNK
jgi:hypothetical protein